ncbi:MAG TPA: DUF3300 domain-containing protein [Alphaproteobacteria bacterium]|nr:DUF3300 domain-containing protein [Alphaproteobacteria bacterium]
MFRTQICSLKRITTTVLTVFAMGFLLAAPTFAQGPPEYRPDELDRMVSRIALYPDPLLAQVLAAATYSDQIPDAARWADQHHYLSGDSLAQAINNDQLPWDPSVQALLPFPSVLDMMASDMNWTRNLGDAFLAQEQDVMYAVQRMRQRARDFGYLRTGPEIIVSSGPYITIYPARRDYIVVPYYDPAVVYVAPRRGFFVGAGIGFRFGVVVGPVFRPWGWGYNRVVWENRTVIINNNRWDRRWDNRTTYVHPYTVRRYEVRPPERHEVYERSERERTAERYGYRREEEHRREVDHDRKRDDRGRGDRGRGDQGDRGKDKDKRDKKDDHAYNH